MIDYQQVVRNGVLCTHTVARAANSLEGFMRLSPIVGVDFSKERLLDLIEIADIAEAAALSSVLGMSAEKCQSHKRVREVKTWIDEGNVDAVVNFALEYSSADSDEWDAREFLVAMLGSAERLLYIKDSLNAQLYGKPMPADNIEAFGLISEAAEYALKACQGLGGLSRDALLELADELDMEEFHEAEIAEAAGYKGDIDPYYLSDENAIEEKISEEETEAYLQELKDFEFELTCPYCGDTDMVNLSDYIMESEETDIGFVRYIEVFDLECEACGETYELTGTITQAEYGEIKTDLQAERN